LFAADRRRISCWGFSKITVSFGGSLHSWRFLKAKVRFPIIGIDFLSNKNLLVDPAAQQLVPAQPAAAATAVAAMTIDQRLPASSVLDFISTQRATCGTDCRAERAFGGVS
jgi:hypothetical protein